MPPELGRGIWMVLVLGAVAGAAVMGAVVFGVWALLGG